MSLGDEAATDELDNYELGRPLARGGMGSVMVAEDRKLGREVALKVMSLDAYSDDSLRRRFVREAHVLAQLAHPNIVPIYDLVRDDGVPQFYTMKLVHGRTLQEILDGLREGRDGFQEQYRLDQLLLAFLKVCDAIGFAHSQGVVHRDLKPANVMVGEFGEVLVMDWGLAGLIDDVGEGQITNPGEGPVGVLGADAGLSLTLDGAVIGTPRYMSPEQAQGRLDEVGPASDIFSLGGILYAILTLHPPVDGGSVDEVLKKISDGDIQSPSGFASSSFGRRAAGQVADAGRAGRERSLPHCPGGRVPPALSAVAMRALALAPSERYADAGQFAADINAHIAGFATSAEDVGALRQIVLLMKRHKAVTAALLAVVLLSVAFMLRLAAIAEAERQTAAVEHRNAQIAIRTAYSATLAQALAARERHDFGAARRLLAGIDPARRGFDWRLLNALCAGDDLHAFRLGEGAGSEPQCFDLLSAGERIAIISADGQLHLRDADGGEIAVSRALPALPSRGELQRYYGLAFSPGGSRFAYGNGDILRVLDAASLEVIFEETLRAPQFDWLDNGRLLYGFNGSVARPPFPEAGAWILELDRGKDASGEFPRSGFPQMCAPLAVSPDRKFFVLHWVDTAPTSWERRLNLFPADAQGGDEPMFWHQMPGIDYPGLVSVSRGGKYIAYTGGLYFYLSRSAHVLDVESRRLLFDQKFHVPIHAMAFDSQETSLGLVGGDGVVRLYDFSRGEIPEGVPNVYDDEVLPERSQVVVGAVAHAPPRNLLTRSAQDGRSRFFLGHEDRVFDLAFSSVGGMITAGSDGFVRQWDIAEVGRGSARLGHLSSTHDLEKPACSADGRRVLVRPGEGASLWDVAARSVTDLGYRHGPLAIRRDGRLLTFAQPGFDVFEYALIDGVYKGENIVRERSGGDIFGNGRVRSGQLSDDETRLAIALPGQLICFDLVSGSRVASRIFGQRTGPLGVASHDISPDGRLIASSGFGTRVSIHRFEDPDDIVARLVGERRDFDTAVVFSHDGKRLYTGNEDGRVRVWDTGTWQEIRELGFAAHRGAVSAIALSSDRELIATSGDETLKLFPAMPEPGISDRRERLTFVIGGPANWIAFARDAQGRDRALLHSSPGGALEVWETDSKAGAP